jgi:hypothetical protein
MHERIGFVAACELARTRAGEDTSWRGHDERVVRGIRYQPPDWLQAAGGYAAEGPRGLQERRLGPRRVPWADYPGSGRGNCRAAAATSELGGSKKHPVSGTSARAPLTGAQHNW